MSKILTYKMTYDSGFAPNPFWGCLTLAACTPNHSRADLQPGDWIVGLGTKSLSEQRMQSGLCLEVDKTIIYIAQVNEISSLNEYFNDARFADKKFQNNKGWERRRGDNVYYCECGEWRWTRGHCHDPKNENLKYFHSVSEIWSNATLIEQYRPLIQDIRGDRVFISGNFSYFGDICVPFDVKYKDCVVQKQGIKYCRDADPSYADFLNYLKGLMNKHGKGQIGNPISCHIKDDCKDDKIGIKKSC